jgi:hypothetical protein
VFAVVTLSCLKMLTVAGWRIVGVNGDPVNDLAHLKQLLSTTTASAEGGAGTTPANGRTEVLTVVLLRQRPSLG